MIFATAGHTDHGKTHLIKSLTGVETDKLPEEKIRGLTIDLGFAYLRNKSKQELGFIDVPGHKHFSRNMLSGITGVKNVILVIAADDGLMPQTIEHIAALHLLEIELLTVVVTKIDLVNSNQIKEVVIEINKALSHTCLGGALIKFVSNKTGENISELRDYLFYLDQKEVKSECEGVFRMAIDRRFLVTGVGQVITGTVHSGKISVNDSVKLFPDNTTYRIRGLRAQDRDVDLAFKGDRCAINIGGGKKQAITIKRGMWLRADSMMQATKIVDVLLKSNPFVDDNLKNAMPVHFHHGTSDIPARLFFSKNSHTFESEEKFAQIRLERETLLFSDDKFVLRNQSSSYTLAGGIILDPHATKQSWHHPNRKAVLKAMMNEDRDEALKSILTLSPEGVFIEKLLVSWDLSNKDYKTLNKSVLIDCFHSPQGKLAFSHYNWSQLSTVLMNRIREWHKLYPALLGVEEKELFNILSCQVPRNTIACVILQMVSCKQLLRRGGWVYHYSHRVILSEQEMGLWKRVSLHLEPTQSLPPKIPRIATDLSLSIEQVQMILKRACDSGNAIITNQGYYFTTSIVFAYAEQAEELAIMMNELGFSIVDFRKHAEIGRNLAYELLTYFEKIGFTHRKQNRHYMQGKSNDFFGVLL